MKHIKTSLLGASVAILLSGCGGDSAEILPMASPQDYKPKAGDPLYTSLKVDGQEIQKETYRYYAINDSGRLVAEAKEENANQPHITLLENVESKPMSVAFKNANVFTPTMISTPGKAEMIVFTESYIEAMRKHYPNLTMRDIALQIGDMDTSLEKIRLDYESSGFDSIDAYVNHYEWVDKHFGDNHVNAEASLRRIALSVGGHQNYLNILRKNGISLDSFYQRVIEKYGTLDRFYDAYYSTLLFLNLEDFIKDLMGLGKTASVNMVRPAADPVTDGAKVAVEAGKLGLAVAKFAWEIIKDARPVTKADGAYTTILSIKDKNYENYGYSVGGTSAEVDYEGKNLFTMTLFHAKFRIDGYYNASNPNVPGNWMPSVAFKVDESFAALTWNLNAGAAITSAANLASPAAPEPEIQIVANVQANGWFQSFTNSFTFYANGRTGFRKQ